MDENKNPFGGKPVLNPTQPADTVPNPPGPQPPQTPPPTPPPSQDVPPPPPAAEEPDSGDGPGVSAEDLEQGGLPPVMPAPSSGDEPSSATSKPGASSNKKRLGVIAGIVAAILILTAIPGGVYLVQQRQQYISQARSTASEAGDNAWNSCKIAGGSDAECRQQAEAAYMSVASQVKISPEEAHEDQVRDAFRQKAISDVGGSEKLTPQLKDQIQQQSDQIAKDPSATPQQAIQAAEKLVASFEEGAKCTYPEEYTEGGKKKVRVCNGLRKEGKCQFDRKVDPACKEVTPGEAGTSSDTKLTFPPEYTDYVYFDCDKCSPDRKCQTPNIGVNPKFFAGQAPHAPCRQRDICNPKKPNDCLLVDLCDKECSGPAPVGAPQIAQTPAQETAECKNIKIYDASWKQLAVSDIEAGDTVRLAVSGITTEAKGLTKARFRINSGSWKETTQKNPAKEFFTEFQVPTTGGNFKVEAMVFNPDLGWK